MCCFSVLIGACVYPAAADEPGDSPDYPIFYSFSPPPGWGFPLGTDESESMMFSSGGTSDYNYNNEINGDDIDAFIEDYVRSKAAADLNNDGNIDSADLARFVSGLSE